jgi:hypothetical protein
MNLLGRRRHPPPVFGRAFAAFVRLSLVFMVILICSSNITNSVLLKWGFQDKQPIDNYAQTRSLVGMMHGTAPKPFVYRSTLAQGLMALTQHIPSETRDRLFKTIVRHDTLRDSYFEGIPDAFWTPRVAIAYHLMYLVVALTTMMSILLVYRLSMMQGLSFVQALGFSIACSMMLPLTFQQGGYYYDFVELLGVLCAVYLTLKKRHMLCTLCVVLFSFNKETFFLVPLALYFLHPAQTQRRTKLMWTGIQTSLCLITRSFIMHGYDANAGGMTEWHLMDNVQFWLNPSSYFIFYNTTARGIFTPSLQNPLALIPLIVFMRASWQRAPIAHRHYLKAALLPLVPLFVIFGNQDEVRVLILAFPALILIALSGAAHANTILGTPHQAAPDTGVA